MKTAPNVAANLFGAAKIGLRLIFSIFKINFEKRAKGEIDNPKALNTKSKTKSKTRKDHLKNKDTAMITIKKRS